MHLWIDAVANKDGDYQAKHILGQWLWRRFNEEIRVFIVFLLFVSIPFSNYFSKLRKPFFLCLWFLIPCLCPKHAYI